MATLQKICLFLTILGGINWLLIGLFDFNMVTAIFNESQTLVRIIYSIIGIASLVNIGLLFTDFEVDADRRK